jgi:hypothetical protein
MSSELALRAYLAELKRSDPLQDVPMQSRTAVGALRLIEKLLWIAHQMPSILYPTLDEEDVLRCLRLALGKAAYSFEVLCIAYRIDPARLRVRSKRPQQVASTRSEALADLQSQLLDQCWSHSHAFTLDSLRWSREIQRHEAAVQLGCTWYALHELATWCHSDIVELLLAYGRGEEQP